MTLEKHEEQTKPVTRKRRICVYKHFFFELPAQTNTEKYKPTKQNWEKNKNCT